VKVCCPQGSAAESRHGFSTTVIKHITSKVSRTKTDELESHEKMGSDMSSDVVRSVEPLVLTSCRHIRTIAKTSYGSVSQFERSQDRPSPFLRHLIKSTNSTTRADSIQLSILY